MSSASLISVLLVALLFTSANAFQTNISPSRVRPGDAFSIRICGSNAKEPPSAFLGGTRVPLTPSGEDCFIGIGAVDIDTNPGVHEIEIQAGEASRHLRLSVKPTRFPSRSLRLPDAKVFLSKKDLERARSEKEKLDLLWQQETGRLWEGSFILPLKNNISTTFGVRRILNKRKSSIHLGVDIKGREGEEVEAANRGRVALAEELLFGGNTVVLDHGQGIFTIYMHLSGFNAEYGSVVSKGDCIGYVGSSGRSSGPHLHFGAKVMHVSVNPISLERLKLEGSSLNSTQ